MTVKTCDERSYDLAEYFLTDEPGVTDGERMELALVIQDAIESWIQFRRKPTAEPESAK